MTVPPKPDATEHVADRANSTVLQWVVDCFETDSKEEPNESPQDHTMLQGEAHPPPPTSPQQQRQSEHCQQDSTSDSSKINLNQCTSPPPPSFSTQETTTCGSDGAPTEVGSPKSNSLSVNLIDDRKTRMDCSSKGTHHTSGNFCLSCAVLFCLDLVVHVVKWIFLALVDQSIGRRGLTVTHFTINFLVPGKTN